MGLVFYKQTVFIFQYRDSLPKRKEDKKKKRDDEDVLNEPSDESTPSKKTKKKHVYGVINNKYYSTDNSKSSIEALRKVGSSDSFEERERVFEKFRSALMTLIR